MSFGDWAVLIVAIILILSIPSYPIVGLALFAVILIALVKWTGEHSASGE